LLSCLQKRLLKICKISTLSLKIEKNSLNTCNCTSNSSRLKVEILFIVGLKEDYRTVKNYLTNLKTLHEEGNMIPGSMIKMITIHNDLLSKSVQTEQQMDLLYKQIVEDYKAISEQLDQLEKK
jgi:hypothetical protein